MRPSGWGDKILRLVVPLFSLSDCLLYSFDLFPLPCTCVLVLCFFPVPAFVLCLFCSCLTPLLLQVVVVFIFSSMGQEKWEVFGDEI